MFEDMWKIMKEYKFEIENENERNHELKCSICNELMIKACSAPCGCQFCSDCIENYLEENDKFCLGTSKRQNKMINYVNDIVIDYSTNIRISEIVVKCPKRYCQYKEELEKIENHMETCDRRPISCPYYEIGCEMNEVIDDEMKDHLNENSYCHSKLLMDSIDNLWNEMESVNSKCIDLKRENSQLKQKLENIKFQSTIQHQNISKLERKERENATGIEILNHKIIELQTENYQFKYEIEKMVKFREQENVKMSLNQEDQIYNFPNQSIKFETEMKEESFCKLDWFVENLSQQLKNTQICSESFYSEKFGYKMCVTVILSKNLIYFYFNLMRGKFDSMLIWPFKYSITIHVIDQENQNIYSTKTQNFIDNPDHDGRKKPLYDINTAIYLSCITLSTVRNDQVLIKCRVKKV